MLAWLKLNLEWIFNAADLTHFSVLFFRSILVNSVDFLGEFRRYEPVWVDRSGSSVLLWVSVDLYWVVLDQFRSIFLNF
jgi:hypothetical protein